MPGRARRARRVGGGSAAARGRARRRRAQGRACRPRSRAAPCRPGELARPALARIGAVVGSSPARPRRSATDAPRSLDVHLALPDGRTLAGTVTGVCGDTVRAISYSRVQPARPASRVGAAAGAERRASRATVRVGGDRPRPRRARAGAGVTVARIPPLGDTPEARRQAALEQLAVLLDLYDRGMREPLPLACDDVGRLRAGGGGRRGPRARRGRRPRRLGDRVPLRQGGPPARAPAGLRRCGSAGPPARGGAPERRARTGWDETETTRFGRYALRLWRGLLAAEELSDR